MTVKVLIEKGEDGYYSASCPSLKSCWSQGKTKDEAIANMKEAIELYLDSDLSQYIQSDSLQVYELTL